MPSAAADFGQPAATEPDLRRYPRVGTHVQIEIREENNDVPMRLETTDLSRGGCYVQLLVPSVGLRVRLTLWLDGYPALIQGVVVTRHPQYGNGIRFVDFDCETDQLLKRYLEIASQV
jgi:hypothetical protein